MDMEDGGYGHGGYILIILIIFFDIRIMIRCPFVQCVDLGLDLPKRSTVKPRPEAHMDMILFEVFLKSIVLIPQQQILQRRNLKIL